MCLHTSNVLEAARLDADLQVGGVPQLALVGERQEAQLVQRIARVGDQLPQEDLLRTGSTDMVSRAVWSKN